MGEVRRVHVIYFLSRMGHVEHPHLLRVQHVSRNGVFLGDVKRWLAALRGNEMPEAFSWSYKRRYKNGYVWQDLMDDDLITPISDNEYVLKGSEIFQKLPSRHLPYAEKKAWEPRKSEGEEEQQPSTQQSTSRICKESPVFGSERSTTTNESTVNEDETSILKNLNKSEHSSWLSSSSKAHFHQLHNKNNKSNSNDPENESDRSGRPILSSTSSKSSSYTRSKSYSSGASQMFRSLITCGGMDTNDTVLIPLNQSDRPHVLKGEKIGGSFSTRVLDGSREDEQQQQQQYTARKSFDAAWSSSKEKIEFCKPKMVSAASKPSLGPFCSQCGKSFRPEKMHSHMKACRGMKSIAKSATTSDEKTRDKTSPDNESTM